MKMDTSKHAVDVELAAVYATKAADRVRRNKDDQRGEDCTGRSVMADADELYVRLRTASAKLADALDELMKARTEAALANGETAWSIGEAGGHVVKTVGEDA
jgi:hypothetical protein